MRGWLWGDGYGGGEVICLKCGYDQDLHMRFDQDVDPTYLFKIEDDFTAADSDRLFTICDHCGKELTEVE